MKIAIFGANGTIGQRIVSEAVQRGHEVTAVVREDLQANKDKVKSVKGDVIDAQSVAKAVAGCDVVISAVAPSQDLTMLTTAAHSLLEGLSQAGVKRLIVVGGAGSLEVAPGLKLIDAPSFPAAWKGIAQAHTDALEVYRNAKTDVDWTSVSPPALIQPGERTGKYRLGGDQLVSDEQGNSHISAEDYAIALIDEAETPKHSRERFTVGY